MNLSSIGGAAASAYAAQLLARAQGTASTDTSESDTATTSTTKAKSKVEVATTMVSSKALATTAATHAFAASQTAIHKESASLIADLRSGMAQAGVQLGGTVEFSVNASGTLQVKGSEEDKAKISAFLKADTASPSLGNRLASLAKSANTLSGTIQRTAAISQAARYSSTSNFLSAYGSLVQGQAGNAAALSLSAATASFSYPGMLASRV